MTQAVLQARAVGVRPAGGGTSPLPGRVGLAVSEGEVLAVTGASGSGKTTLLRCLALLEAEATGAVEFRGAQVPDSEVPAFRRQVVYVAQTPPRFPMSVGESLSFAFELGCAEHSFDRGRAEAAAKRLALPGDVMDRRLADLSGGEAQRVSLLRALLVDPAVLLLDEPTSALDPEARDAVVAELRTWLDGEGRAAIIVSHDADFTAKFATRLALLRDGELVDRAAE